MDVMTEVQVHLRGVSPERAFDFATTPENAARFFTGYGPVPAIRAIEWTSPGPTQPGRRRRVELADGSALDEVVLAFDPPSRHVYRVSGYHGLMARLVRDAEGTFSFEPTAEGTRLGWHYRYRLTSPLVWPLAALVIRGPFRRAMGQALANIATQLGSGG